MTLTKAIEAARGALKHGYDRLGTIKDCIGNKDDAVRKKLLGIWAHADKPMNEIDRAFSALPDKPMTEDEIFSILFYLKDDSGQYLFRGTSALGARAVIRALKAANVLYVEDK